MKLAPLPDDQSDNEELGDEYYVDIIDVLIHEPEHPFCDDMTCPCHEDQDSIQELGEFVQDGIAIHRSEEKEKRHMRPNKANSPTAELNRQVIAQIVPAGVIRRASAVATQQTEPVPVWTAPQKRTARIPTPVLLLIGFILGLLLIFLGIQVVHWINEVSAHWHGGDGSVTALDADVGHGGTSHFLAFYQNGAVIVVECSSDYSTTHTYTVQVHAKGTDHHAVSITPQVIGGRRDLVITLDDSTGSILYNTGDGMSIIQP